jgi:hypothetical protein
MNSTEKVIREHKEHEKLIRSVIRTVGKDSLEDIYNHGADCGYLRITYTNDCIEFAWRHRESIIQLLEEFCEETGEKLGENLQGWRCIGKDYKVSELLKSLYSSRKPKWESDIDRTLWNGLAWYACEEVARWLCDE